MNELQKIDFDELEALEHEAMRGAGAQKMLKFRKGDYFCDNVEVAKGTQMIAHVIGWTKQWVKFVNRKPVERRTYRVFKKEVAPERDQMPDNDEAARKLWPPGIDGKTPADPWSLQYLLPMENPETGDQRIFVTSSSGGKNAVEELVLKYTSRRKRDAAVGQPLIRLQKTMFTSPAYGPQVRPLFEIVSYEAVYGEPIREVGEETLKRMEDEMNDEIPF